MTRTPALACVFALAVLTFGCTPSSHRLGSVIVSIVASPGPPPFSQITLAREDFVQPLDSEWTWQLVDASGCAIESPPRRTRASTTTEYQSSRVLHDLGGDTEFFCASDTGTLTLSAVESATDHVRTLFTPPLAIDWPANPSHPTSAASSAMRVEWLDGRGLRDSGVAERSSRIIGVARVATDQGAFDTIAVESDFHARLRIAQVHRIETSWIAPSRGTVVVQWDERVSVLGVELSRDCGRAVRISPIPAADRAGVP